MTEATRERLVTAAMNLFAERGMRSTTVGTIEEDAGLTRRGGAFYKYFRSKDDVLAAGVEREIKRAAAVRGIADLLPLGDVRSELKLLCRLLLAELGGHRQLTQVLEKEGDRIPDLRRRLLKEVIDADYR